MKIFTILQFSLLLLCTSLSLSAQIVLVVNTTDDFDDGNCNDIHCSLREAISLTESLRNTSSVEIQFNLSGTAPHVIYLNEELPVVFEAIIDGTSQSNFSLGDIIIDGRNIPDTEDNGLILFSSEVYGLHLRNFDRFAISFWGGNSIVGAPNKENILTENLYGIHINGQDNILIQNNFIGTNPDNDALGNFQFGLDLQGGAEDAIIRNNVFAFNSVGVIFRIAGLRNSLCQNSFYCNEEAFYFDDRVNENKQAPIINDSFEDLSIVKGTSEPNDKVELYKHDESLCDNSLCQAGIYLGSTEANNAGDWVINGLNLDAGDWILASATSQNGSTSPFSDCVTVNTCTTNNLAARIDGASTIDISSEGSLYSGIFSGAMLPIKNHIWNVGSTFNAGRVIIEDRNDGTALIKGTRIGQTVLTYTVVDAEGCTFTVSKVINITIDCNSSTIVNSTTIEVTSTEDSGPGSLRYAIHCANFDADIDNIHFNLPGEAPYKIELLSGLPALIDEGITIDGTTQPNYTLGDVVIDGTLTDNATAFYIGANNCSIYGLRIQRMTDTCIRGRSGVKNINIGAEGKGNILIESLVGIFFCCSNGFSENANFAYNYIGTDQYGNDLGHGWEGINIQGTGFNIHNNVIAYNRRTGILPQAGTKIKISQNSFFCNRIGIRLNNANNDLAPAIIQNTSSNISGVSQPNTLVELYIADEECLNTPCQGKTYIGSATANSDGEWSFEIPTDSNLSVNDRLTATATDEVGNTSEFSSCFVILPDECSFAQELPVNLEPCSTVGAVLDLKQLTNSNQPPTSKCASSYKGKDAWLKVIVPATGNFLVRANINNTVTPVIEAYTGTCESLSLLACQTLDTIPFAMVFENYTPESIVFLRIWDEDNTLVDGNETVLLHLTVHELTLVKDDWEICDQENNLINGNPTILSERDANTFIIEFDSTATGDDITNNTNELKNLGDSLLRTCSCGGQIIQLWETTDPITLEDRRRSMKKKTKIHDPNYNYVFETREFQINAYAIGQQYAPDIAMDREGNFAIVWSDEQRKHNYCRIYSSSGNPITQEFQLGTNDKVQLDTKIGMANNGDFIAVWHAHPLQNSTKTYVYARAYTKEGKPKDVPFLISKQGGTNPDIAVNGKGEFVVVWHEEKNIYAQYFDNLGNAKGDLIRLGFSKGASVVPSPSVSLNDSGSFIITWSGEDSDKKGIYAQRFSNLGKPVENTFLVNEVELESQNRPDVVLSNDGSFIIVWESFQTEQNDLSYDIIAQRFNASGTKEGNEFIVNTYRTQAQRYPSISSFDDGTFVIAWSSFEQDGFEEGIFAKFFNSEGQPIGEEFQMNTFEEPDQDKPTTATNGKSILISAWEDGSNDGSYKGIFGQRYEIINRGEEKFFYPIGTATPSILLGDELKYPESKYTQPYQRHKNVKIAIIDTGVDSTHSYVVNAMWRNPILGNDENCTSEDYIGYDFLNRRGYPLDLDGHGTRINNRVLRAFEDNVHLELMNLKFHELGKGRVFDAICAIYYAVDNGADILNLSWGFEASEFPSILYEALKYASDKGVLIVTSAGNSSKNNDKINKFPANLNIENLITVTAFEYRTATNEIKLANYASFGKETVDIAAYGFIELPTANGGFEQTAGTSMAAPAVANTAATIKGLFPILTAKEIKDCILSTVIAIPSLENKVATGGILNHEMALDCAKAKSDQIIAAGCLTNNILLDTISCNELDGVIQLAASDNNLHFLWDTGDITSSLEDLRAGVHTVLITNAARCQKELSIEIGEPCVTSTNYVENNTAIKVFPNPANHYLNILINKPQKGFNLSVVDMSGRKIIEKQYAVNEATLDTKDFVPGMYILSIDNYINERIVISR